MLYCEKDPQHYDSNITEAVHQHTHIKHCSKLKSNSTFEPFGHICIVFLDNLLNQMNVLFFKLCVQT